MVARKKIAILGGGLGAITAAIYLTQEEDWQDHYDITLYQMGWRLGGKGASGRNAARGQRIEEHGLHYWYGFYENAFSAMRICYVECAAKGLFPRQDPMATWQDAFHQQHLVTVLEKTNPSDEQSWRRWEIRFPEHSGEPGDGTDKLTSWEHILTLLEHLEALFEEVVGLTWLEKLIHWAFRWVSRISSSFGWLLPSHLHQARAHAQGLHPDAAKHKPSDHHHLEELLLEFLRSLEPRVIKNPELRHLAMGFDLGCTAIIGMLRDGVLSQGFDPLNDLDLSEWLEKHGAKYPRSPLVKALYDGLFAYDRGNAKTPDLAAGVALSGSLHMFAGYKGAINWKMMAGMGDTVFAPAYLMLKNRGVKFHFFHRVDQLHLSKDKTTVDSIDIGVQMEENPEGYQPLCFPGNVPSWPSEPLYEQLVDGDQLRKFVQETDITLENAASVKMWKDRGSLTLRQGIDFDEVLLAIPVAAHPLICPELVAASPRFRSMVDGVSTTPTQGVQVWLTETFEHLGWNQSEPCLGSGYKEPLDTVADMSHLIEREEWHGKVKSIAYFCGALEDEEQQPPPYMDPDYLRRQRAKVKQHALRYLNSSLKPVWPGATTDQSPYPVRWELLECEDPHQIGEARFDAQFWKANVDPSERYTLSAKKRIHFRLHPGHSCFENLYLAGDWTWSGLNAGCVEGTVMSGMTAAGSISGRSIKVLGQPEPPSWALPRTGD